ncbi:MAG TPA: proton-conducting transporter membrane subunit [Balneolales bacterium]|nr:proton-conducting transporter membrane subunit [Balneolales bacterium]
MIVRVMWAIFIFFTVSLIISFNHPVTWKPGDMIIVDQLSLVIGTAVTLFSSLVLSYSSRYLAGSRKLPGFLINCMIFTFSVILMVIANNIVLFAFAWLSMGLLMSELIGGYTHYEEGLVSRNNARNYFMLSTSLLTAGLILLALQTGSWSITKIIHSSDLINTPNVQFAIVLVIGAAVIQSALFPFQSWLMSSMTAPTPSSALMHAGFVNAGAILLTRLAPAIYVSHFLWILVLVGGLGSLIGKFTKFVQANIKQKLACSTAAQMGFMLVECGLGFFAAAITHLILHGFYKAYLFLSSGDSIEHKPVYKEEKQRLRFLYLPMLLISGIVGGLVFAYTTGKGIRWDSSLFLTLVVVVSVVHGSRDLLKHTALSAITRIIAIPFFIIPAILVYALFYNGITRLLGTIPMVEMARSVTWDQIIIGILYLVSFLIIELKLHHKFERLYVFVLNISQPKSNTILH